MPLSPREVKRTIAKDLKERSISRDEAASRLNMSKQALANLLSQPKYFSRAMSNRFHEAFDYYIPFLISGEGELMYPAGLLPNEKKVYSESLKRQQSIMNDGQEDLDMIDPITPEIEKEMEYYRSLDINDLVENQTWDTEADYSKALLIREVFSTQIQDISVELEFTEKHRLELLEEIKRLRLENLALRRNFHALSVSKVTSKDGKTKKE